jgi:hypothetical protein
MLSYSGAVYSKFKDKINVMIEIRNVEREVKSRDFPFSDLSNFELRNISTIRNCVY